MSNFEPLTQKQKKNIEVTDERSTPEARAARVKRLRNLANLSRKEMCDDEDINLNTLKGWEIARYGGLPIDGAQKIVKRVAREGVFCTIDWLLYEEGQPPRVNVMQMNEQYTQGVNQSEEKKIEEEIELLKKHYKNVLFHQISDDGMSPFYEKGEFVAGIKETSKQIDNIIGSNCIVQLENGQLLCRKLRKGKIENLYTLVCMNFDTSVEIPIIADVELISAAMVVWHRKIIR